MNSLESIIEAFKNRKGVTFAGLTYTNSSGETSNYTIMVGAFYARQLQKSLKKLEALYPNVVSQLKAGTFDFETQDLKSLAVANKYTSFQKSLGGAQPKKNGAENWETIVPGIKKNLLTGQFNLTGIQISRKVIVPGTYKKVNHKPLTDAQNKLEKELPISKYRIFNLGPENLTSLRIGGKEITHN